MADLLEYGLNWLDGERSRHMSRAVAYQRGESQITIPATRGVTVFEVDSGMAVLERFESRDFIVSVDELAIDGVNVLPERGDRIHDTINSVTYIYEVMAPGRQDHYRTDPARRTFRIHTKHVDTETL